MRIDAAGPDRDRRKRRERAAVLAILTTTFVALAAGCGDSTKSTRPEAASDAAADFHLVDVNPASSRHDQAISPRDYLERVSAWYFGHAT